MPRNQPTASRQPGISLVEAAGRAGGSAGTLRRWAQEGLIPQYDGTWSRGAVGHARIIARLRERGHSLEEIKRDTDEGRLAFGYIEELFPSVDDGAFTLAQASQGDGASSSR